jgi:hypothetical protein
MASITFDVADECLTVTCEDGDFTREVHGHAAILAARSEAVMHAMAAGHTVRQHETTDKVVRPWFAV